ncbi:MAG: UDP-4-amino-4,6-dideoxy-N-acetyl-beta-L-altrosamine transaminase [Thermacetogeniaceae bacterium]|jgi:UDP-4-amino-4,6-dideoxy-N-acetyl-beta-L-altrosamine transaminase
MKHIPYGRQDITDADVAAVAEVLRSDWITQGPAIERFERAVAKYCGARYAVAVSSGTAALHIACLAAGLGAGDYLWTSPNTFVASANCAIYCGAQVDFVDIDPRTYNMSPEKLAEKLSRTGANDRLPKVVVPVHFSGQSCTMQRIHELAVEYGFIVIEDASHAIGGSYKQLKVGSCSFSDMTVFSFHPVKIITTGEGGMVLTNREDLYEILVRLRSHGITRDPRVMLDEPDGPWYYQQIDLGYNYRMADLQAALGLSQLGRIDAFVARRRELAARYHQALHDLPLTLPWQHPDSYSAYHLYVIRLHLQRLEKTRLEVFEVLRQAGIGVNVHYIPVHTQPYYRRLGFKHGDFPEAERYYEEAITLPLYYALSEEDQDYVIDNLKKVLQ